MKRVIARIVALVICLGSLGMTAYADTSASTKIIDTSSGYQNNIDLAIAMLDGAQVWSDENFSFNDAVGPRTREEGYESADNGRGSRTVGGGVSQVATTLYLALERRGDVDYIEKQAYGSNFTGGYVSSGSDAIVTDYNNDVDFSFLNTGASFTIEMYRSGNTVYCSLVEDEDWDDSADDYEDDWGDDWDDDYIFAHSSYAKLTRDDVRSIDRALWAYARNEIYARHGYQFKTKKYRDYFMEKDWYRPGGFSVSDLNATEWYNMDLIKSMEGGTGSAGSTTSPSDTYIFPHSSSRKLTRREILAIPSSQWGYARNEIYARHGYVFKTQKYKDYFTKKYWYAPGGFKTTDLNETEWYNMQLIKELEDEYGLS